MIVLLVSGHRHFHHYHWTHKETLANSSTKSLWNRNGTRTILPGNGNKLYYSLWWLSASQLVHWMVAHTTPVLMNHWTLDHRVLSLSLVTISLGWRFHFYSQNKINVDDVDEVGKAHDSRWIFLIFFVSPTIRIYRNNPRATRAPRSCSASVCGPRLLGGYWQETRLLW